MLIQKAYRWTIICLGDALTIINSYFGQKRHINASVFKIPKHLGIICLTSIVATLDEFLLNCDQLGIRKISFFCKSNSEYFLLLPQFSKQQSDVDDSSCRICKSQYQIRWKHISVFIWKPFEGHSLINGLDLDRGKTLAKTLEHGIDCEVDLCISPEHHLNLYGVPPQLLKLTEF